MTRVWRCPRIFRLGGGETIAGGGLQTDRTEAGINIVHFNKDYTLYPFMFMASDTAGVGTTTWNQAPS